MSVSACIVIPNIILIMIDDILQTNINYKLHI